MPKGTPKDRDMYGINPRPWGFEVSVMRERVRHHAEFGVAQWGGREEALRQAQAWRDAIVKRVPPIERRARSVKLVRTNKSGIAGVSAVLRRDGSLQGWRAHTLVAPGKLLQAYFSATIYGEAALDMAIFARNEQLKLMEGLTKPHPAEELVRKSASTTPSPGAVRKPRAEIVRRSNSSGVSGVQFKAVPRDHPGYWLAITEARGSGTISKAFSVKTYGFEKAKELAIEERARQLAEKAAMESESN